MDSPRGTHRIVRDERRVYPSEWARFYGGFPGG
jgi:hypothetical protein